MLFLPPRKSEGFELVGVILLSVVALTIISCGIQTDPEENSNPKIKPLKVGMELAYPPFEMVDDKGSPSGVSVEIAKSLAKDLGRPLEIQNIEFSGLIESLRSGKIDIIISSLTATDRRRRVIDFSNGYVSTGLCLLLSNENASQLSIENLNDAKYTVAVKRGTTGHVFADSSLGLAKVRVLENEDACVLEVIQGKADAFIYDQMSVFRHWNKNRKTTKANLKPFQQEFWSIGIAKNRSDLKDRINTFLGKYNSSGGFDDLADRFLPDEKAAFEELGYPFIFQISGTAQ